VEVSSQEKGILKLVATLFHHDKLAPPLLPGFNCQIASLFI
jgi:hypothetical protein